MRCGRLAGAFVFSTALHATCFAGYGVYQEGPVRNAITAIGEKAKAKINSLFYANDRRKLVKKAKKERTAGQLEMGRFLLRADYIDARAKGNEFDFWAAMAKYHSYLNRLNSAIAKGKNPQTAVAEVLKEMHYYGLPEVTGRMADALTENGGTCQAIAHLTAALLYDAGYRESTYLRVYSNHIVSVFADGNMQYDINAGGRSDGRGVLIGVPELIDAYEKARAKGGFSYPPTKDRFDGSVPIFSRVGVPGQPAEKAHWSDDDNNLLYGCFSREEYDTLNPLPAQPEDWPDGFVRVTLVNESDDTKQRLEKIANKIEQMKKELVRVKDDSDAIHVLACGTALYTSASWHFRTMQRHRLADAADKERERLVEKAEKLLQKSSIYNLLIEQDRVYLGFSVRLSELTGKGDNYFEHMFLGEKGQDIAFSRSRLTIDSGSRDHLRYTILPIMLAYPPTHKRALHEIKKLSKPQQFQTVVVALNYGLDMPEREDIGRLNEAMQVYVAFNRERLRRSMASAGRKYTPELKCDADGVERAKAAIRKYALLDEWERVLVDGIIQAACPQPRK